MTIRRAARGLFAFAIFLFTTFASAPPGATQSPVPVTLRLVSQTPWNTPRDTVLEVAVRADSTGAEPIDELTLGITIGYAGAVTHGVRGVAHRRPGAADLRDDDPRTRRARAERHAPLPHRGRPVDDRRHQRHGVAHLSDADRRAERRDPGRGAGLAGDLPGPHARGPAPALDLDRADSGPIAFDPERGDWSTPGSRRPWPRRAHSARRWPPSVGWSSGQHVGSIDLVIQPILLDQLARMADGYERADGSHVERGADGAARAAAILDRLRDIVALAAGSTCRPCRSPDPRCLRSSRADSPRTSPPSRRPDASWCKTVLGLEPAATVARPPEGAIDDDGGLRARGARRIDDPRRGRHVERPPQPNEFAPLADGDARGRRPDDRPGRPSRCRQRRRCSRCRASSTTRCERRRRRSANSPRSGGNNRCRRLLAG